MIELVKKEGEKVLEKMLQLYLHDVSLYFPIDFEDNTGTYTYDSLEKYFDNSNNYAYFIKSDDKIAGFMLVNSNKNEMIIQEMFVLNNYKNKGIGKQAVFSLLDKYKGNWNIKSLPTSILAEKFWDRTIKEYINNNYCVEHIGRYNRAVFTFNNSDK